MPLVLLQHQGLFRRNARAARLGLTSPLADTLHSLSSIAAHHSASTRSPLRTRVAIGALLTQGGLSDTATRQGLPQSLLVLNALSKAHLVPFFFLEAPRSTGVFLSSSSLLSYVETRAPHWSSYSGCHDRHRHVLSHRNALAPQLCLSLCSPLCL